MSSVLQALEHILNKQRGTAMRCTMCRSEAYDTFTSEAIEMDTGLLVIRNIPCYRCKKCYNLFCAGNVLQKMERMMRFAEKYPRQVTILDYSEKTFDLNRED